MIISAKETKAPIAKVQGTGGSQFDYSTAVNHNTDVDIKYTITHTFV